MSGNELRSQATESNSSPTSPPPFMAGMVEIEVDKETGHVEILDYVAVVDCGTVVNPNLCRMSDGGRYLPRGSAWRFMRMSSIQ